MLCKEKLTLEHILVECKQYVAVKLVGGKYKPMNDES